MKKVKKSPECPNCGQELHGENYCPSCGQLNDIRRLKFWSFINDSLSNFLAFDGKFFHTIYYLFRFPGRVAREYISGKRMRYMHPLRIYFLSSVLLLFPISIDQKNTTVSINQPATDVNDTITAGKTPATAPVIPESYPDFSTKLSAMTGMAEAYPHLSADEALDSARLEKTFFHKWLYQLIHKGKNMKDGEFMQYFYSKLFWVLFLFLPILALWLKLIYIRHDILYIEHLFFVLYTQSTLFLLMLAGYFIFPVLITLIFIIYFFAALLYFYRQSFFKTFLKFILLNIGFGFLSLLFLVLALIVSFVIY